MKKILVRAAAVAVLLGAVASAKAPYVEAIYPLQQVLAESFVIVEGKVESHDPQKKIATIKIGTSVKGKCTYELIRLSYGGGQFWHPEGIPKHFVKGAPVLMFYNEGRQAEVYLNRFFFQLYGDAGAPPEKAWWSMTHIEIRMNRTFNGTVEELTDTVKNVLAGKAKPPAPDPKIPPIDLKDVKALPAFGEPLDESKLTAPFARKGAVPAPAPVVAIKAPPAPAPAPAPKAAAAPRAPENPAAVAKGLAFSYYEGAWTALPEFEKLAPSKAGTFERPALQAQNRPESFGLRFTGFLDVPREGVYTFSTASNDGSKLFIGTTPVVNNDHHHGVIEQSGEIALKAGKHAITVTYFQAGGQQALEVFWTGPELPKQPIPATAFFRPANP
jgi:PA14 domain-containing protein